MAAIVAWVPSITGLPKALDLSPPRGQIFTNSRSDNLTQHGEEWPCLDVMTHLVRSRGEGWITLIVGGIVTFLIVEGDLGDLIHVSDLDELEFLISHLACRIVSSRDSVALSDQIPTRIKRPNTKDQSRSSNAKESSGKSMSIQDT